MEEVSADSKWFAFESVQDDPNSETGFMVDEGWLVLSACSSYARKTLHEKFSQTENLSHLIVGDNLGLSSEFYEEHKEALDKIAAHGFTITPISRILGISNHPALG
jgi:hypothetical protein